MNAYRREGGERREWWDEQQEKAMTQQADTDGQGECRTTLARTGTSAAPLQCPLDYVPIRANVPSPMPHHATQVSPVLRSKNIL